MIHLYPSSASSSAREPSGRSVDDRQWRIRERISSSVSSSGPHSRDGSLRSRREKRELRESTDRKSKTTVKRREDVCENRDTLGPYGPREKGTNKQKGCARASRVG